MNDDKPGPVAIVCCLPFAFAFVAACEIWSAYVLTRLWRWYVVPGFGIQPISALTAFGICLTLRVAKPNAMFRADLRNKWSVLKEVVGPAIALLSGWIGIAVFGGAS